MIKQILLLSLVGLALASQKSYDGYKVFTTSQLSAEQASLFQGLQSMGHQFDFWTEPAVGKSADIMVAPEDLDELFDILDMQLIQHSVKIQDVGVLIEESKVKGQRREATPNPRYALNWDDYYSHADINAFIDELASTYPTFVRTRSIGRSFENRDMRAIEITKAGAGKPNVFIEAGIHAREWIASAVCTYTISELIERDASHPTYLNSFNFYIVPMANPDGYEYSRNSDRLWRKNRKDNGGSCYGVDLNRNWAYHFGESGTSNLPCAETYLGTGAFSEVESQHIRDYFSGLTMPQLSVCLHCYGEYALYPYGYAVNQFPANVGELRTMANAAVADLNAVYNSRFTVINSAELYPAAGASDDWYKSQGSRYTYTYELRDQGLFGFVLPPAQIIPSGREMWAAWESMFNRMMGGKME